MNVESYFKSLSLEFTALKDRVRNFIDDAHWPTDGGWKETVLRTILSRSLPQDIQIGQGFIVTPEWKSTQIDILLYSSSAPLLFRDGNLVIVQPSAVRGVIEVKTKLTLQGLRDAVEKIKLIGEKLPPENEAFLAIFSYDSSIREEQKQDCLNIFQQETGSIRQIVNFVCLGESRFIRYWDKEPGFPLRGAYEKWHSYHLQKMAYGYFIHNVLLSLSPKYIDNNQALWFPETSKEFYKDGAILRNRGPGEPSRIDLPDNVDE